MNIHYIKHVPFESLGCMNGWVKKAGNHVTATKFYEDLRLPFIDVYDFLIIMGGPMGVYDEDKYPWLKEEKKLIEKAIENGKKIIGICLGAQLIAEVLGAKVYKNDHKEIGWFPVEFTEASRETNLFKDFPQTQTFFHWHGDTFDLPKDSIHIARSEGCVNQSYLYKDQVLGLQFHPEASDYTISLLLENCKEELIKEKYIQSEEEIRKGFNHIEPANQCMRSIFDKMMI